MFSSSEALAARKCKVLFTECFCSGTTGDKGPTGDKGLTGDKGPTGDAAEPYPQGNTLFVDAVYGVDISYAVYDPSDTSLNTIPFKTIQAALNAAAVVYAATSVPQNVKVRAGIYEETLVIPANISLTGDAPQAVVIRKLNVSSPTKLITMGVNCRAENFTAQLSGTSDLTGVWFPTGTSTTAKLRNSIWTITYDVSGGSNNVYGVLSDGTDASTAYSTPNAIQRSTINVISSSTGSTCGILVNAKNRFAVRDIVVYARGTGTNIAGVTTDHVDAVFEGKTSTFGGDFATTNYDVHRKQGTLILGATDLLHNDANGKSFKPAQAPSLIQYGMFKTSLQTGTRYYLVPGTVQTNQLDNDDIDGPAPIPSFNISKCLPFIFDQEASIISLSINVQRDQDISGSILVKIYSVDGSANEVLSYSMASGTSYYNRDQSFSFPEGSLMGVVLEYTGTDIVRAVNVTIGYY